MSINVTVTGNPVSIKRGKMITANPYDEKQEYEKRRLMRLEQVRQQSKEFAQDVRNKVRKEKKKQLGQIEKESKEQLKSWQNRKLLDLQTQYRDALDEIGLGHKAAEEFENETELLEQQKQQNQLAAQARGRVAVAQSQVEKNEVSYKKALPVQHKKLVQDIENTRAAMVSSLAKHKKVKKCCKKRKKSKSTDINITLPNESQSESTENSSETSKSSPTQEESDTECWEDCSCSEEEENGGGSDFMKESARSSTDQGTPAPFEPTSRRPLSDQTSYRQSIENRKKLIDDFQSRNTDYPRDTRISDRIKQRELQASEPDFCDFAKASKVETVGTAPYKSKSPKKTADILDSKEHFDPNLNDVCECIHFHSICPCKKYSEPFRNISVQTDQVPSKDKCTCNHHQPECPKASKKAPESNQQPADGGKGTQTSMATSATKLSHKHLEIPSKPPVSLKGVNKGIQSSKTGTTSLAESQKVNYYDHPNRYQGTIPSTTTVERIGPDSLEAMPNVVSEAEWHEKMRQRDKEAEMRGRKAMEKELIRRDYEEMMKKLPLLQKKEHIAEIGRDKPEYHMSEERLKELEKKKQLKLENAFTNAFPSLKPAIVTLPSRKYAVPLKTNNEPFDILDPTDPRIKNTGKWDTDFESPKMFTAHEVQEIIRSFTGQKPESRYNKLKQLLKSLKIQKQQLINELKTLPRDDSVNALLEDLNSVSDSDEVQKPKHKKRDDYGGERKRRHDETQRKRRHASSEDPSSSSSDSYTKQNGEYEGHREKERKSKKKRPKVLILQNMSTQTTPKPSKSQSSAEESKENLVIPPQVICKKTHTLCDCRSPKDFGSSDELCKIFIKLQDNEDPKVEVVNKNFERKETLEKSKEKVTDKKSPRENLEQRTRKSDERQETTVSKEQKGERKRVSPRKLESKGVGPEIGVFKKPHPVEPRKPKVASSSVSEKNNHDTLKFRRNINRQESWQEQLSKNSFSTSSTSYFSPPDFLKAQNNTAATGSFYNLRQKPKQQNISASSFNDERVLKYIEKLLSMSKASVDDLQISSSDIQTPNQSIIEMETNNPLAQLHNIVKFINLKANQVAKELSYSSEGDFSAVPPNTTVNTTTEDSRNKSDKTLERTDKSSEHSRYSNGSCSKKSRDSLLHQYTDVTDSCSKRIANLAAMIEQLREEKMRMLKDASVRQESPASAKDYSTTAYLDLPQSESSKNSTVTSLDEEELQRRILEIDMSLAEKLKKFSEAKRMEGQVEGQPATTQPTVPVRLPDAADYTDDDNRQFLERLRKLTEKNSDNQKTKPPSSPDTILPATTAPSLPKTESKPFMPLMLNIPQLPVLEAVPDDYVLDGQGSGHKHPPPSKGLAGIKRLNGNVSVVPHELSTIVEADSQLSTKASPNTSKLSISPLKDTPPPAPRTGNVINDIPPLIVPERTSILHYDTKSGAETDDTSQQAGSVGYRKDRALTRSVEFEDDKKGDKETPTITEKEPSQKKTSSNSSTSNKSESLSTQTSKSSLISNGSSSTSIPCTDATCNNNSSMTGSKMSLSSSSSDDLKSLEAMLKSIGMDWAIPTLHKTQEALALASSSSSPEVSSSRKTRSKTNINQKSPSYSEISLKDFLTKQMMSKISSSSMKSESSPASFLQEMSDISAIQASSGSEKIKQRTSTPLGSKATSKSRDSNVQFFTGASDISSVKMSPRKSQKAKTDEEVFKSLSESARSNNSSSNVP